MAESSERVVATNRRARRDYDILDTIECGLVLRGSEVKSLRESKVTLADAYGRVRNGELWLMGLHITPYRHMSTQGEVDAERDRKLLAHRAEIDRLGARLDRERLTLVPLRLYFRNGKAKVQMGLAKGRKQHDKRAEITRRDMERETARDLARARRR